MYRVKYILLLFCLSATFITYGQESMMTEISLPFLDKLISTAKQNYPRVKTYDSKLTIAEYNIKKAKLDWFNIFTLSYLYSPGTANTVVGSTNLVLSGYQFGIYTSVGSILQKAPAVKVTREEYKIAQNDKAEYDLSIEAAVKQRYYVYIQQLTVLKIKSQTVADAESSVKLMKYKFEKGEETFDSYNKALMYFDTNLQIKIDGEAALLVAKSSLEELLGVKLEDVK
ncbi:MAG: TolC family protein [Flavipsychrobacter sp.]|nr:TolC family protein [Flavipsychrobacter sp.]